MQDGREKDQGPLSSQELEHDAGDVGTTFSQEEAAGHTISESKRDATEDDGRSAGPEPFSGIILPPD